MTDINDNAPKLAIFDHTTSTYSEITNTLETTIHENKKGALIFDSFGDKLPVVVDFDASINASFILELQLPENETKNTNLPEYFKCFIATDAESDSFDTKLQNYVNFNIFTTIPLDFEAIDAPISTDQFSGIPYKQVKLNLIAREVDSAEKLSSKVYPILINIRDQNDNTPEFEKTLYNAYIDDVTVFNTQFDYEIVKFSITDKDSGIYGLDGLVCDLRGTGEEK